MAELLDGRGVVVTGAGRGLGRSFAIAAARAGAGVVVNDIDVEEAEKVVAAIEAEGGSALASGDSVADWEATEAMIESCVSEFGAIDGLVNNAVAYSYLGPPWDENGEQIRKEVEVALIGTLNCGVHAMRRMKDRGAGSIVNLTSRSHLGMTGHSTYTAAKGGIASATYSWALELLPYGVRVNALSPGAHTRGHQMAAAAGSLKQTSAVNQVSPDVIAPGVVYLLSDLAARVSGQVLTMLGHRFTLQRHPRLLDHVEEREEWTPELIAELIETVYADDLQPIGHQATEYQLGPVGGG